MVNQKYHNKSLTKFWGISGELTRSIHLYQSIHNVKKYGHIQELKMDMQIL